MNNPQPPTPDSSSSRKVGEGHTPGPFEGKSLPELMALRDKGRRAVLALEMGHLADMRVSARYEPYAPDSFDMLDRNEAQIRRYRSALATLDAAIALALNGDRLGEEG